jgi:hypothetical protein
MANPFSYDPAPEVVAARKRQGITDSEARMPILFRTVMQERGESLRQKGDFTGSSQQSKYVKVFDLMASQCSAELDGAIEYFEESKKRTAQAMAAVVEEVKKVVVAKYWSSVTQPTYAELLLDLGFSAAYTRSMNRESQKNLYTNGLCDTESASATKATGLDDLKEERRARTATVKVLGTFGGAENVEKLLPLDDKGQIHAYAKDPADAACQELVNKIPGPYMFEDPDVGGRIWGCTHVQTGIAGKFPAEDHVTGLWVLKDGHHLTKATIYRPDGRNPIRLYTLDEFRKVEYRGKMLTVKEGAASLLPLMANVERKGGRPSGSGKKAKTTGSTSTSSTAASSGANTAAAGTANSRQATPIGTPAVSAVGTRNNSPVREEQPEMKLDGEGGEEEETEG